LDKSYSIFVKGGMSCCYFWSLKKNGFFFGLDSSNELTINVDESLENIRSGTNGIIISLPKQKYLSYLLKFSNQEGKLIIILNIFRFIYII
jgi:hypothetical protein